MESRSLHVTKTIVLTSVYGLCLALLLGFGPELRWSIGALPGYLRSEISGIPEAGRAVLEARQALQQGNIPMATSSAEGALEIDPHFIDALYTMIEANTQAGERDKAEQVLQRLLSIDKYQLKAYRLLAQSRLERNDLAGGSRLLLRGLSHFEAEAPNWESTGEDESRYQHKAKRVYASYQNAIKVLRADLYQICGRLDSCP